MNKKFAHENKPAAQKCNQGVEYLLRFYKTLEKIDKVEDQESNIEKRTVRLDIADKKVAELLAHKEKIHRKIMIGKLDFLIEVS